MYLWMYLCIERQFHCYSIEMDEVGWPGGAGGFRGVRRGPAGVAMVIKAAAPRSLLLLPPPLHGHRFFHFFWSNIFTSLRPNQINYPMRIQWESNENPTEMMKPIWNLAQNKIEMKMVAMTETDNEGGARIEKFVFGRAVTEQFPSGFPKRNK